MVSINLPYGSTAKRFEALPAPLQHDAFRRSSCRSCSAPIGRPFLDLGVMPLANAFAEMASPADQLSCPLSLVYCPSCHLVQLTHVVPADYMFSHYLYVSSTTESFIHHFQNYARMVRGWLLNAAPVVDIGSNDGLLVKSFIELGIDAVGVEPATNLSDDANRRGLPTINRYFDRQCVDLIVAQRGRAGVVTANNVFAHVDDVAGLCRNVKALLRPDGLFVIECPYIVRMCEEMLFDMIYHEHLSYLSVTAIHGLLNAQGFEILDIQEVSSHGGSIRVIAQHMNGPHSRGDRWREYLTAERERGYQSVSTYEAFAARVNALKNTLRGFVADERAAGAVVVGFGAPAKANTLINFCGWSVDEIAYLVDDNPLKQGRFTPGSRIPVVSRQRLIEQPPDSIIVFAWNFADEIVRRMRSQLSAHVRWIIPFPLPHSV